MQKFKSHLIIEPLVINTILLGFSAVVITKNTTSVLSENIIIDDELAKTALIEVPPELYSGKTYMSDALVELTRFIDTHKPEALWLDRSALVGGIVSSWTHNLTDMLVSHNCFDITSFLMSYNMTTDKDNPDHCLVAFNNAQTLKGILFEDSNEELAPGIKRILDSINLHM